MTTNESHPLVELEGGFYLWSLEGNDPTNFWDRFLDNMTDQPEDKANNIRLRRAQARIWIKQRLRDLKDNLI